MDPLALMILIGGLAFLLWYASNPNTTRRCKDCGMPSSGGLSGGLFGPENEHWPNCPSLKKKGGGEDD